MGSCCSGYQRLDGEDRDADGHRHVTPTDPNINTDTGTDVGRNDGIQHVLQRVSECYRSVQNTKENVTSLMEKMEFALFHMNKFRKEIKDEEDVEEGAMSPIRRNYVNLTQALSVDVSSVVGFLFEKQVLNSAMKEHCTSTPNCYKKASRLLDILYRNREREELLYQAATTFGLWAVADILREDLAPHGPTRDSPTPSHDALGQPLPVGTPYPDALGQPLPVGTPYPDALGHSLPVGTPYHDALGHSLPVDMPYHNTLGHPLPVGTPYHDASGHSLPVDTPYHDASDHSLPFDTPYHDASGHSLPVDTPYHDALLHPLPVEMAASGDRAVVLNRQSSMETPEHKLSQMEGQVTELRDSLAETDSRITGLHSEFEFFLKVSTAAFQASQGQAYARLLHLQPRTQDAGTDTDTPTAAKTRRPALGFRFIGGMDTGQSVLVSGVDQWSPAGQHGGLMEGDTILAINGTFVDGCTHESVARMIKDSPSGQVRMFVCYTPGRLEAVRTLLVDQDVDPNGPHDQDNRHSLTHYGDLMGPSSTRSNPDASTRSNPDASTRSNPDASIRPI